MVSEHQIAIVPAPRELMRGNGCWVTSDPAGEAVYLLDAGLAEQEYRISVTANGATLRAGSADALRHARQTFTQLESCRDGDGVPCVEIADAPVFAWRGLMLDVARHFMPKDVILRLVDALELHRMNVLHLHLTDDQGWRVQIDAYPKLTEVGAWRRRTMVGRMTSEQTEFEYDDEPHGGFYTKDDLREIVAYAADRGITVVPEIDLPGHMQAAVAAYPQFGNHPDRPVSVREVWGISEDVLNAEDATVEFVRTVLREVLEIFPGQYVHLGGDECPARQWRESQRAQRRMAELGLSEAGQLQGWFTAQVASVLAESGRRLVGWDEMLETDCPKDAVIMAWRSHGHAELAAKAGHDVVVAPNEVFYFDHYQADPEQEGLAIGGHTTLRDVYDFEILPNGLTDQDRARIIGAQCQIWTEYMPRLERVGYMLFPRLSAFAERAWGSPRTSYDDFLARLRPHLRRIEDLGLTHRPLQAPAPGSRDTSDV
jgi:hexosaminidase